MLRNIVKILFSSFLIGAIALVVQKKGLLERLHFKQNYSLEISRNQSKNNRFFSRISLSEAIILNKNPKNIFVDVRNSSQFSYGRIPDALNIPFKDMENISPELLNRLHKAPNIVLYCLSATCDTAEMSAVILSKKGLKNLKVYTGGWGEWKKCDLPVESLKNKKRRGGQSE